MMMMTRRSYSDPRDAHPTCQILPKLIDLSWVKIFLKTLLFSINTSEASPSYQHLLIVTKPKQRDTFGSF